MGPRAGASGSGGGWGSGAGELDHGRHVVGGDARPFVLVHVHVLDARLGRRSASRGGAVGPRAGASGSGGRWGSGAGELDHGRHVVGADARPFVLVLVHVHVLDARLGRRGASRGGAVGPRAGASGRGGDGGPGPGNWATVGGDARPFVLVLVHVHVLEARLGRRGASRGGRASRSRRSTWSAGTRDPSSSSSCTRLDSANGTIRGARGGAVGPRDGPRFPVPHHPALRAPPEREPTRRPLPSAPLSPPAAPSAPVLPGVGPPPPRCEAPRHPSATGPPAPVAVDVGPGLAEVQPR